MDSYVTPDVAVARLGTVGLAARSPWTNRVAAGTNHALGQSRLLAAGHPQARRAAFPPALAQAQSTAQQAPSVAAMAAELLPTTETVTVKVTNKPNFVHKTRINAGGYGAMGPHPDRERLA